MKVYIYRNKDNTVTIKIYAKKEDDAYLQLIFKIAKLEKFSVRIEVEGLTLVDSF